VDEEFQGMPETYWLPVLLYCLEGQPREEAAQRFGWTSGDVKARPEALAIALNTA
jgi:hypothetical protein